MIPQPTHHRWPWHVLRGDYIRGAVGLSVTAGPLLAVRESMWATLVLGTLALLFAWFLARTVRRHRLTVITDDDGIRAGRRYLRWPDLAVVKARRFGAQRRDGGYVEATLKGSGRRITIDSQITDSRALFRRLRAATDANGVVIDDRTRAALAAMDV